MSRPTIFRLMVSWWVVILDIDSIDVLELIIMLRKDYGVVIKNKEQGKIVFASLRSLAAFILETSPGFIN